MISPHDFEGLPLQDLVQALRKMQPNEFSDPEELQSAKPTCTPLGRVMSGSYDTISFTPTYNPAVFLSPHHPDVKIPAVDIGEYLGGGAQGKVYSGVVRNTGLVVAVKVVLGEGSAVREALICSRLRHRNVVRVFDVQRCGEYWVSIMEMVRGNSLQDQTSTPRRARQCFAQLAEAVDYISDQNVVHCDIKPPNIGCRRGDDSPVLLDFGMAVDQSLLGNQTRAIGGTPLYLPPEAFLGENPHSSWDAYALGVTAIQVVADQADAEQQFSGLDDIRTAKISGEFARRLMNLLQQISDRTLRNWCSELVHEDQVRRMAAVFAVQSWDEVRPRRVH